jgi:putative ABC transport system permease protein
MSHGRGSPPGALPRVLRRLFPGRRGAALDAAVFGWPRGLSIEFRLAIRTLGKSPGLTIVGVLGIALGTAIAVGFFVVLSSIVYPKLPLDEGERIVAIENRDIGSNREDRRTLHDYLAWRAELRTVTQVGAASFGSRLLVTGDAPPREVRAAAMTAAAFEVPRVPPLLGRLPDLADERPGAPPVVVLGHELWQAHFTGERGVIGQPVMVGDVSHTVVGVMPPGFSFPRNEELWTALQPTAGGYPRGGGPELFVFGRLAPGATLAQAQAEVAALGARAAEAFAATNAHLQPLVLPYTIALDDVQGMTPWTLAQLQFMVTLILVAIAANIAVLVYARTALRQGEIAVRTALGASRRRIVMHLFVEALVLSLLGAGLGLAIAHVVLQQAQLLVRRLHMVGFWVDYAIQPSTVALAAGMALMAAVIVGVLPALRSTGRQLDAHMRRMGGGGTVALGRMWTSMIVLQVAVAVRSARALRTGCPCSSSGSRRNPRCPLSPSRAGCPAGASCSRWRECPPRRMAVGTAPAPRALHPTTSTRSAFRSSRGAPFTPPSPASRPA